MTYAAVFPDTHRIQCAPPVGRRVERSGLRAVAREAAALAGDDHGPPGPGAGERGAGEPAAARQAGHPRHGLPRPVAGDCDHLAVSRRAARTASGHREDHTQHPATNHDAFLTCPSTPGRLTSLPVTKPPTASAADRTGTRRSTTRARRHLAVGVTLRPFDQR